MTFLTIIIPDFIIAKLVIITQSQKRSWFTEVLLIIHAQSLKIMLKITALLVRQSI